MSSDAGASASASSPFELRVPAGLGGGKAKSSTSAVAAGDADASGVRRNAKGGVYVAPHELHQAFEFFDVEGKGFITISDLKKRLGVFYQNLSLREYKFLMNNKQELTESDLLALLSSNELTHYDPVAEAFRCYDPNDTGFIDLDVFREILTNLGFGDITDQDIQTLIDTCDVDGDGRVSLADFRRMLPSGGGASAPSTSTATATAGTNSAATTAGVKK